MGSGHSIVPLLCIVRTTKRWDMIGEIWGTIRSRCDTCSGSRIRRCDRKFFRYDKGNLHKTFFVESRMAIQWPAAVFRLIHSFLSILTDNQSREGYISEARIKTPGVKKREFFHM